MRPIEAFGRKVGASGMSPDRVAVKRLQPALSKSNQKVGYELTYFPVECFNVESAVLLDEAVGSGAEFLEKGVAPPLSHITRPVVSAP